MKALQNSIHLFIILAISLASTGFRVNISDCHDEQKQTISFFGRSDCCCDKSANESRTANEDCGGLACVMPSAVYQSFNSRSSYEQLAQGVNAANTNTVYAEVIYPSLQAAQPYFSLPPPHSGRFKGILHQKFLI